MRQRHPDLQREGEAARPSLHAAPAPQIARLLALQGSAGNQAVGRMLFRIKESNIEPGELRRLRVLHKGAFAKGAKFASSPHAITWAALMALDTVEEVRSRLEQAITAAEAAAPKTTAKPRKTGRGRALQEEAPAPQPDPVAEEAPAPPQKKAAWQNKEDLVLVKAAPPMREEAPLPEATLADCHTTIKGWNAWDHDGMACQGLGKDEVDQLLEWLKKTWEWGNSVFFRKGAGTGKWAANNQLKVIAWNGRPLASGKRPTFHFTLSDEAYAHLQVDSVLAEWQPTPAEEARIAIRNEARALNGTFAQHQLEKVSGA
jgi:hypothetical protein